MILLTEGVSGPEAGVSGASSWGVWSRGMSAPGGVPGGDPLGWLLLRTVRILLECILVIFYGRQPYRVNFKERE